MSDAGERIACCGAVGFDLRVVVKDSRRQETQDRIPPRSIVPSPRSGARWEPGDFSSRGGRWKRFRAWLRLNHSSLS